MSQRWEEKMIDGKIHVDARGYLSQYKRQLQKIQRVSEQIESLDEMRKSSTKSIDGVRVQTSTAEDKLGDLTAEIDDLIIDLMGERSTAIEIQHDICRTVKRLSDSRYMSVIWERYISLKYNKDKRRWEYKEWEEVADAVGYSYDYVKKLNKRALKEIDALIGEENAKC
jgi:chromosome segregation ATPase